MNREIRLGVDGTELVNRLAEHVHHATEGGAADRNLDRIAGVHGFHTTNHTLGRLHRDRAYAAFSEMLLDFDGDVAPPPSTRRAPPPSASCCSGSARRWWRRPRSSSSARCSPSTKRCVA